MPAGVELGDEIDIKLAEKKGAYGLAIYSTIGIDLLDIGKQNFTLKAAIPIGPGFKFTLSTRERRGAHPDAPCAKNRIQTCGGAPGNPGPNQDSATGNFSRLDRVVLILSCSRGVADDFLRISPLC
jgi:hypothetical protein